MIATATVVVIGISVVEVGVGYMWLVPVQSCWNAIGYCSQSVRLPLVCVVVCCAAIGS